MILNNYDFDFSFIVHSLNFTMNPVLYSWDTKLQSLPLVARTKQYIKNLLKCVPRASR